MWLNVERRKRIYNILLAYQRPTLNLKSAKDHDLTKTLEILNQTWEKASVSRNMVSQVSTNKFILQKHLYEVKTLYHTWMNIYSKCGIISRIKPTRWIFGSLFIIFYLILKESIKQKIKTRTRENLKSGIEIRTCPDFKFCN